LKRGGRRKATHSGGLNFFVLLPVMPEISLALCNLFAALTVLKNRSGRGNGFNNQPRPVDF